MTKQDTYDTMLEQLQEQFANEAGAKLEQEQIHQILSEEKEKICLAQQCNLSAASWMGNNLQRYCKDLLRRHQPFFTIYYLLSVCTEASLGLFFLYLIEAIFSKLIAPVSFTIVPGMICFFVLWKGTNQCHIRRILNKSIANNAIVSSSDYPKKLSSAIRNFRIISFIGYALLLSLCFIAGWDILHPLFTQLSWQSTFFLAAGLLFLSGIHNVLYQSHLLSFFTPGAFRITRHSDEEIQTAAKQYFSKRYSDYLTVLQKESAKKPAIDLQAGIRRSLRSHLITNRIYLFLGFAILLILDILCIYQYIKTTALSLLLFGMVSLVLTLLLFLGLLSCHELLHQLKDISLEE